MNFDDLTKRQSAWLRGTGADSDAVISSRIRLARNLSGFPFVDRATKNDLQNIVDIFASTIATKFAPKKATFYDFSAVSASDGRLLLERQLISQEFIDAERPRALLLDDDENFSVMVNEEDHLRLQATASGFSLQDVWAKINALDDALESELQYAFDEKYGYLTACPSNVGTGIRASVMLHLPALIQTNEISKVLRGLQKMNLAVRGIYGEGSRALGEFFQVSNQATLGASEEKIVEQLSEVISSVLNYERQARQTLLERDREGLLDRTFRALALLRSARTISMEEAMNHLSSVRLGVWLQLIDDVPIARINKLLLRIQPAHLRRIAEINGVLEEDEEILRADYLREQLLNAEKNNN